MRITTKSQNPLWLTSSRSNVLAMKNYVQMELTKPTLEARAPLEIEISMSL